MRQKQDFGEHAIYGKEENITIAVTSETGEPREYKVKIIRELDNNNRLTNIIPSSGAFEEEFMYEKEEYTLNLDEDVQELSFEVTTESIYAEVNGNEARPVPKGESTRTITVTAENGEERNYIIHITRKETNNSYLKSLVVDGYELDKVFKKDEYSYVINVPYEKKFLLANEVTAIPEDEKANVQKTSGLVLTGTPGKNIFEILVTAQDGFTTSRYTIEVIRECKIEIIGKAITENKEGKHTAEITAYDRITKEEITKVQTNEDGTFKLELEPGIYEISIKKGGYLNIKITNIELTDKIEEKVDIGEHRLIAGDTTQNGAITIDDLVKLNEDFSKAGVCDLNEDGQTDEEDRNILKKNYGKTAQTISFGTESFKK